MEGIKELVGLIRRLRSRYTAAEIAMLAVLAAVVVLSVLDQTKEKP